MKHILTKNFNEVGYLETQGLLHYIFCVLGSEGAEHVISNEGMYFLKSHREFHGDLVSNYVIRKKYIAGEMYEKELMRIGFLNRELIRHNGWYVIVKGSL